MDEDAEGVVCFHVETDSRPAPLRGWHQSLLSRSIFAAPNAVATHARSGRMRSPLVAVAIVAGVRGHPIMRAR